MMYIWSDDTLWSLLKIAWVAWVVWVHKILAWVMSVKILALVVIGLRCFGKNVLLKILQNLQENTSTGVSYSTKL